MQNGIDEIMNKAERIIRQMVGCGLSYSANDVKRLVEYVKTLEKNQKAFIDLTLKYSRLVKKQQRLINKMDSVMTRKQKRIINKWLKEGENK